VYTWHTRFSYSRTDGGALLDSAANEVDMSIHADVPYLGHSEQIRNHIKLADFLRDILCMATELTRSKYIVQKKPKANRLEMYVQCCVTVSDKNVN
jgi:hypothetical protein